MNDNIPDKLFIDNQWIAPAGGKTLASINPADESVIGEVACAGEEEVSAAVASAKRAFGGEWRRTTPWERGRVLMKISHLIKDNVQSLADMECVRPVNPSVRHAGRFHQRRAILSFMPVSPIKFKAQPCLWARDI